MALFVFLFVASCSNSSSKNDETKTALSPERQAKLVELVGTFEEMPVDMHAAMAARVLSDIESERLPPAVLKTLVSVGQVSPSMREAELAKGIVESKDVLEVMCKGAGLKMMQALGEQAPGDRLATVREQCQTDRFQLATSPSSSTDPVYFLLAHMVLSHLQENGGVSVEEKTVIMHLALAPNPTAQ